MIWQHQQQQQQQQQQQSAVGGAASRLGFVLMHVVTLPYYRFFRQNTLLPIQAIAKSLNEGGIGEEEIRSMLARWRARKLYEMHFIQIALGPAAWYTCLILSLFAILLSSSEAFIFSNIQTARPALVEDRQQSISSSLSKEISMIIRLDRGGLGQGASRERDGPPSDREKGKSVGNQQRYRSSPPPPRALVRWNMVFTWQAPMMLLAYSVGAFLVGVTVYVCTPLYADDNTLGGRAAAYFYLSWFGVAAAVFVWCSFWAYKFVDLDRV
ncbi:hypothetical protein PG987_003869 [Apiospora arundinis]